MSDTSTQSEEHAERQNRARFARSTFPRSGVGRPGYDPDAVDDFFEEAREYYQRDELTDDFSEETIRNVFFPLVRNGYQTKPVDLALERLEVACWQRRRSQVVEDSGPQSWLSDTYERAATLYPRLGRPRNERFKPPRKGRGYRRREVDDLLDTLSRYFDGDTELTADEIRKTTFPEARRSRSYDIAVVDVYLDRAIAVLQAVE